MKLTQSHILVQALSATQSPVTITDAQSEDNPIIYCNQAFLSLTGYTFDEVIGRNCRFLQGEETEESEVKKIRASISQKTESHSVLRNYTKDGKGSWNDLHISPVFDQTGTLTHFIGLQLDITERIEQEKAKAEALRLRQEKALLALEKERLLKLNEAKDDFIAIASHQLRTPATVVKQYLGMMNEGMLGPFTTQQSQALKVAYENNDRQLSTIDELLRIARIDAGKVVINKDEIDVAELIAKIIKEFDYRLIETKQTIRLIQKSKHVTANIDRELFQSVMENLIDNCIKYSREKDVTTVTTSEDEADVIVSVSDTGIGMTPKDQERIFHKFMRSNSTEAKNIGGTGLGLYWVKTVLDLHDASINVESEYQKGTTFTIRIPKQ